MNNLLIHPITNDTCGIIIYFKSPDEYKAAKTYLDSFIAQIKKPVLICIDEKIQLLSDDALKSMGLMRIQKESDHEIHCPYRLY